MCSKTERLNYEVRGSGDAIVFIHGNAGDLRHWDHQVDTLAAHFRVIRYDVRGYGKSSLPVEGEPYANHEDLAALLDRLGVSKAHVAGWSMGAGIAADFVLAYPERAMSLISIGPWVGGYSSPAVQALLADFRAVATAFDAGGAPAAVQAWRNAPFWVSTARNASAEAEFATIATDYSWWAFSHRSPIRPLQPPAAERLGSIQVPTLMLTAEHDIPACLEIADLLHELVPNSSKVVMRGTGHLLHIERPEEFNRHVIEFASRVAARE
jgi:3-oxoadipate enol-lactonase